MSVIIPVSLAKEQTGGGADESDVEVWSSLLLSDPKPIHSQALLCLYWNPQEGRGEFSK